jgi:hypothetical protein
MGGRDSSSARRAGARVSGKSTDEGLPRFTITAIKYKYGSSKRSVLIFEESGGILPIPNYETRSSVPIPTTRRRSSNGVEHGRVRTIRCPFLIFNSTSHDEMNS